MFFKHIAVGVAFGTALVLPLGGTAYAVGESPSPTPSISATTVAEAPTTEKTTTTEPTGSAPATVKVAPAVEPSGSATAAASASAAATASTTPVPAPAPAPVAEPSGSAAPTTETRGDLKVLLTVTASPSSAPGLTKISVVYPPTEQGASPGPDIDNIRMTLNGEPLSGGFLNPGSDNTFDIPNFSYLKIIVSAAGFTPGTWEFGTAPTTATPEPSTGPSTPTTVSKTVVITTKAVTGANVAKIVVKPYAGVTIENITLSNGDVLVPVLTKGVATVSLPRGTKVVSVGVSTPTIWKKGTVKVSYTRPSKPKTASVAAWVEYLESRNLDVSLEGSVEHVESSFFSEEGLYALVIITKCKVKIVYDPEARDRTVSKKGADAVSVRELPRGE